MNKTDAIKYKVPTFKIKLVKDKRGGEPVVLSAPKAAAILRHLTADLPYEEVWMLMVDQRSRITGAVKLAQGGLHACALLPSDIVRPAVVSCACGIVLGHNHPSGDSTPSNEDIELTKLVKEAMDVVKIPLLDHIIIGDSYSSLFEMGLL